MADRLLLITWGQTVRGREERALEVFNESVGYYGRCQQEGKIEEFNVVICAPNTVIDGYMELKGSAEQLNKLQEEDEFMRLMTDASLIVDDLQRLDGYCNEGVARMMGMYTDAIQKVPQTT